MPLDEIKTRLRSKINTFELRAYDMMDEEHPKRVKLQRDIDLLADAANARISQIAQQ